MVPVIAVVPSFSYLKRGIEASKHRFGGRAGEAGGARREGGRMALLSIDVALRFEAPHVASLPLPV